MGMLLARVRDEFRGITNFDVNSGFYGLANKGAGVGGLGYEPPVHVWCLVGTPQKSNNGAGGLPGRKFNYQDASANKTVTVNILPGQDGTGAIATQQWIITKTNVGGANPTSPIDCPKYMIGNISVHLNLYGARKRDTKFYIDLVRTLDEKSDFLTGDPASQEYKNLIDGLARPLIWSNIGVSNSSVVPRQKLQFVKSWEYTVEAASNLDLNVASGNIKEVRLNINLNKTFNYQRQDLKVTLPVGVDDRDDFQTLSGVDCQNLPVENARYYLMLRAFAPEKSAPGAVDVNVDPSYDMVIVRNRTMSVVPTVI